jgi:hypothetical protein
MQKNADDGRLAISGARTDPSDRPRPGMPVHNMDLNILL